MPIMMGLALGAAVGAGSAALQHKDILQGALIGGATGAVTGGIGAGFGGAAASEGIAGIGAGELAGNVGADTAQSLASGTGGDMFAGMGSSTGANAFGGAGVGEGFKIPSNYMLPSTDYGANVAVADAGAGIRSTPSPVTGTPALSGLEAFKSDPLKYLGANKLPLAGAALAGGMLSKGEQQNTTPTNPGSIRSFQYNQSQNPNYAGAGTPYFNQTYTPMGTTQLAEGGIAALGGQSNMYPMSQLDHTQYATPTQMPTSAEVVNAGYEEKTDPYMGTEVRMASGGTPAIAMSNKYSTPARISSPDVTNYQNMLATRALQEYNQPTLAAMVPQAYRTQTPVYRQPDLTPVSGLPGATPSQYQALQNQMAALQTQQTQGSQPSIEQLQAQGLWSPSGGGGNAGGGLMNSYADGGISHLGDYSDGGRLLKGPGDGVSDDIPAQIGDKQPARLADGEFVVPARIVSELGNGSTDAGAKRLYAMMDRVQANRKKTVGKGKVAVNSKSDKYLPA